MFGVRTLTRILRKLNRCGPHGYKKRFEFVRPEWSVGLFNFADDGDAGHWSAKLFFVWVYLWRASKPPRDEDGMLDKWGVTFSPFEYREILLEWGTWRKRIALPWQLDWVSTEYMNNRGEFVPVERNVRGRHAYCVAGLPFIDFPDPFPPQSFTFRYTTRYGDFQETTVTVKRIERRTWQWCIFRKLGLPLMRRVRTDLDLSYADEMGSERGSWKGGVIGGGCAWVPGESVEAAVRRWENRANLTKHFCR